MTGLMAAAARGMLAGTVGTVAMTLSQRMEMAITDRAPSDVPGQIGAHLMPSKDPGRREHVSTLNPIVHWAHGISMGAIRGMLDAAGLQESAATATHFALVWGSDAALYATLGVAPAPWHWSGDELAADVFHKGVYAITTGLVYDGLSAPPHVGTQRAA